eukprot:scaffold922_cov327-Pinguiococcus_pyrenoidosus.AAC.1
MQSIARPVDKRRGLSRIVGCARTFATYVENHEDVGHQRAPVCISHRPHQLREILGDRPQGLHAAAQWRPSRGGRVWRRALQEGRYEDRGQVTDDHFQGRFCSETVGDVPWDVDARISLRQKVQAQSPRVGAPSCLSCCPKHRPCRVDGKTTFRRGSRSRPTTNTNHAPSRLNLTSR